MKNILYSPQGCWGGKNEATSSVEEKIICPLCNGSAQLVSRLTVEHFIKDEYKSNLSGKNFYSCLNKHCTIAYFNTRKNIFINISEIKEPLWYKEGANPKYICYCAKVTEEQILNAVIYQEARTVEDVIKLTGAMKNSNCVTNNPLGKCCRPVIESTIKKALVIVDEKNKSF